MDKMKLFEFEAGDGELTIIEHKKGFFRIDSGRLSFLTNFQSLLLTSGNGDYCLSDKINNITLTLQKWEFECLLDHGFNFEDELSGENYNLPSIR